MHRTRTIAARVREIWDVLAPAPADAAETRPGLLHPRTKPTVALRISADAEPVAVPAVALVRPELARC
jgi:hypothetical protein